MAFACPVPKVLIGAASGASSTSLGCDGRLEEDIGTAPRIEKHPRLGKMPMRWRRGLRRAGHANLKPRPWWTN